MRLRLLPVFSFISLLLPLSVITAQSPAKTRNFSEPSRTLRFTYKVTVKDIPSDAKRVRVWIPVAQSDLHQRVRLLSIKSQTKTLITRDSEYGNRMMYAELRRPPGGKAEFTLEYEVTRREYSRGDYAELERENRGDWAQVVPAAMTRLLEPDTLIPTDGKIKALAVQVTGSQTLEIGKAKAAYDYLFTNMRYDKTGTGWGRGDAIWACDAKRGNCTDFHSPFIGMLRADGIPARFDIGFSLPENQHEGDIPGYHCWAEFYVNRIGWIPVDISEAWKAQEKRDYFFGSVDANRVQFSTGRDITLSPKQEGPALNYFIYPYVEVDRRPYEKIEKQFSFVEVQDPK